MFTKNKKLITASIASVFLTAGAFYFLAIPKLVNIENYRPEIEKSVSEKIHDPFKIGKMNISMTWDLGVNLNISKLDIKHKDNSEFISAGPISVKVFLPALISKKVLIQEILVKNPIANIVRLKNGTFDIEELIPAKTKEGAYKVILKDSRILAENYSVHFIDKAMKYNQIFNLSGEKVELQKIDTSKHINGVATGHFDNLSNGETNFDVKFKLNLPFVKNNFFKNRFQSSGNIQNFYPGQFVSYINQFTGFDYNNFYGSTNLKFNTEFFGQAKKLNKIFVEGNLNNIYVYSSKSKVVNFPESSNFLFDAGINQNDLKIYNSFFKNNNIDASLCGDILKYRTKKKILDLNVLINNVKVEAASSIFPKQIKIPKDIIKKVEKYKVKANAKGKLRISGPYRTPDLNGRIEYSNLSILSYFVNNKLSKGYVDFLGPTISIHTKTHISPSQYVTAIGTITPFKHKNINLAIKSSIVDIAKAQKILLAIRDIFDFKLGPVPLMHLHGKGKVDLTIHGYLKEPYLDGYVDAINAYGTYDGLAGKAHNSNGRINFIFNKVYFDKISGYVDKYKIIPSGYVTLLGDSHVYLKFPNVDLALARKIVFNSSLLVKVKFALKDIQSASGFADILVYLYGSKDNVFSNGNVVFKNATAKYNGFYGEFTHVNGHLDYVKDVVFFKKLKAIVLGSPVVLDGKADKTNIKATIFSPKLNLSKVKTFVDNSFLLKTARVSLAPFTQISGNAEAELKLDGNMKSPDVFQNLRLKANNGNIQFNNKLIGAPVLVKSGSAFITPTTLFISSAVGNIVGIDMSMFGKIEGLSAKPTSSVNLAKPYLTINTPKFNFQKVDNLNQLKIITPELRQVLAEFKDYKGLISSKINIRNTDFTADLTFDKGYVFYKPDKIPVYIRSGMISVSPENILFKDFYTKISESRAYLNGYIQNFTKDPNANLTVWAKLSSNDLNNYVFDNINQPIIASGFIPVAAVIKGGLDDWTLDSQITLDKQDDFTYKGESYLPKNKIKVFTINANGNNNQINFNDIQVAVGDSFEEVAKSANQPALRKTNQARTINNLVHLLDAKGILKNFKTGVEFQNISISTPTPISIKVFNPAIKMNDDKKFFGSGQFTVDLTFNGKLNEPLINGTIGLDNIVIPSQSTTIKSANLVLNNNALTLTDSNFLVEGAGEHVQFAKNDITDSDMKASATIENIFESPLVVRDMTISSDNLNTDEIFNKLKTINIAQLNGTAKESSNELNLPPVVISDGMLKASRLIINSLITDNTSFSYNLTPDWLLSLSSISTQVAKGVVTGDILYAINTSAVSGKFHAQNIQANAAASTFFKLQNEIYGTLNGDLQFSSKGKSAQEFISNADGNADFDIQDGRLIRLGSLEYLLRAANVLQSGIGGLNVNSILDLIVPQNTGVFNNLQGNVWIDKGVLKTDGIKSQGKNLNLNIVGSLNMTNNYADIIINGRVSKKVTGLLGPLGSISINTFIDYIPGLGFLPSNPDTSLLDAIPVISRIPGLGLRGGKYRNFEVIIKGDLYEASSVKSFRWLN